VLDVQLGRSWPVPPESQVALQRVVAQLGDVVATILANARPKCLCSGLVNGATGAPVANPACALHGRGSTPRAG
jgi:hypothetical protein